MPKDSRFIEWPMKVIRGKSCEFDLAKVADFSDFTSTEKKRKFEVVEINDFSNKSFSSRFSTFREEEYSKFFVASVHHPQGHI